MPYTISVDSDNGVLEVRYTGIVPVAQRFEAWGESASLLRDTGIRRVLIDLLQARPAQELASKYADFFAAISREPLLLASRTAFVAPPVNPINHLIEVLADARHYPFSRFPDRDSALAWLLGDEPPQGLGSVSNDA